MSNVPNRFVDDWGTSLGHGSVCGLKNEWNMVYLLTQILILSLVNIC